MGLVGGERGERAGVGVGAVGVVRRRRNRGGRRVATYHGECASRVESCGLLNGLRIQRFT